MEAERMGFRFLDQSVTFCSKFDRLFLFRVIQYDSSTPNGLADIS